MKKVHASSNNHLLVAVPGNFLRLMVARHRGGVSRNTFDDPETPSKPLRYVAGFHGRRLVRITLRHTPGPRQPSKGAFCGPQKDRAATGSSLQIGPVLQLDDAGDKAGAVDAWMRAVGGQSYRAALDRALPGAFDQAVADTDTFFGQELPAVR